MTEGLYPLMFGLYLFQRCREDGSEERCKLEKCPYLEKSGSEEDISGTLHYMATILGKQCTATFCVGTTNKLCASIHPPSIYPFLQTFGTALSR